MDAGCVTRKRGQGSAYFTLLLIAIKYLIFATQPWSISCNAAVPQHNSVITLEPKVTDSRQQTCSLSSCEKDSSNHKLSFTVCSSSAVCWAICRTNAINSCAAAVMTTCATCNIMQTKANQCVCSPIITTKFLNGFSSANHDSACVLGIWGCIDYGLLTETHT